MTLTQEEERRKLLELVPKLVDALYPKSQPIACAVCDADVTGDIVKLSIHGQRMCGHCFRVMNRRESWFVRLARWVMR